MTPVPFHGHLETFSTLFNFLPPSSNGPFSTTSRNLYRPRQWHAGCIVWACGLHRLGPRQEKLKTPAANLYEKVSVLSGQRSISACAIFCLAVHPVAPTQALRPTQNFT